MIYCLDAPGVSPSVSPLPPPPPPLCTSPPSPHTPTTDADLAEPGQLSKPSPSCDAMPVPPPPPPPSAGAPPPPPPPPPPPSMPGLWFVVFRIRYLAKKKTDPGLCTSNEGGFLKILLDTYFR